MSETKIAQIDKEDIKAPQLEVGGTAIILQRHELYNRDRSADNSGSLFEEEAQAALACDTELFNEVLDNDPEGATMFYFASSDTQYNKQGYRSMETAELAMQAAIAVLEARGIDPATRIINLSEDFRTRSFTDSHGKTRTIRPTTKLREPDIFDGDPGYANYLREKYGDAGDGSGTGLSKAAWAAHEADAEREIREEFGAEGVHDIVDRTLKSLRGLRAYSELFHKYKPGKKLLIWNTTHYDTISPLVKDAANIPFTEYVAVDYGGGIVIDLPPGSEEAYIRAQDQEVALDLGRTSLVGTRR